MDPSTSLTSWIGTIWTSSWRRALRKSFGDFLLTKRSKCGQLYTSMSWTRACVARSEPVKALWPRASSAGSICTASTKKPFLHNRIQSRPEQQNFLDEIKTNEARERYIIAGTPNFDNMVKDYQLLSGVRTKGDLSEFFLQAFEVMQFSARARELAEKAKIKFGMKPNEAYMAVHIRRGNTYAIGGRAGQSTAQEVKDGVKRGEACVGRTLSTIFVSTVRPYLQGEIDSLRAAYPDKRIVGLGLEPLQWDELEPGLDSRKNTILRTAIEMQMWFDADAFGGSRSTMSSFMSLMRLAHAPRNDSDACNRFLQKSWLESRTKIEIP
mmetsp:Transcript_26871/g.85496  ORF Transcript_26871/g.85496 Transcript_26871/m.85496 type:complete len:324 (+) Transcript_26871:246-1217(+)